MDQQRAVVYLAAGVEWFVAWRTRGEMGHDPASAEQGRGASAADGARPDADPAVPANLTKELAHLLAASISQSQASRAPAPGTPTGAEVTSLAAMLANSQASRQPLPRMRDELSSLAYLRPVGTPPAPLRPVEPDVMPHREFEQPVHPVHHDDEPMPIPSTWREPAAHDDERPMLKQMGAALLGLVAGLLVVVPAVLWLTGWMGPQKSAIVGVGVRESQLGELAISKPRVIEGSAVLQSDVTAGLPSGYGRSPSIDATQQIETVLVRARQRIDSGDVVGAREILSADSDHSGPLLFALAETFDPNMLAAWGSRGVSADVQRARALYAKALDLGYGRAMARLDALK